MQVLVVSNNLEEYGLGANDILIIIMNLKIGF